MAEFNTGALYNVFIFLLISICLTTGVENDSPSQNFQCIKEHGNAIASDNCSRVANTTCEFECKRGHVKVDPTINMTLTCTQEGWDDSDILCLAFQCDSFFENATVSENCSLYVNTSCEFGCNSGYTVSDSTTNMTLTCTEEGWIGQQRLCKVFQCDSFFENATASENCSLYENTSCEFGCNSGYTVSDSTTNMTLTCTEDGWIGQERLCKVFQCDSFFENATASENCSLYENTSCEFGCNSGYTVSGSTTNMTLTCTEEGWIGQERLCKVFQCDTFFENATASENCSRYENTTCEFSCNSGYITSNLTANMLLTCTQESWIKQRPYGCDTNIENATASENCSLYENTTCEFSCNSGYMVSNLTTDMTLKCTTEGWIGQDNLCKVYQCGRDFENATASENCSLYENTTCEFECNSGFTVSNLTTNMTLKCTKDGWIGQADLCEANVTLETNSSSTGTDNDGFNIGIGIGVGVGVFVLIVVTLVTFSLLFQRRARKRIENFSNVSVRYQISNVGIDNPAYMTSDTPNGDVTIDDVIDGRRNTTGRRQSSKRYSLSVLEERDGIDLDQTDSDVLTTESWQKEKNIYAEIEDCHIQM